MSRSSVRLKLRLEKIVGSIVNRIPERHQEKKVLLTNVFNKSYMKLSGLG